MVIENTGVNFFF